LNLSNLTVRNFRNIEELNVFLSPHINFICGLNGAGKSSILEAIYFLTNGRSFRGGYRQSLIRDGASGFFIKALATDSTEGKNEIQAVREGRQQKLTLNGNTVRNRSTLVKRLPLLVFSQEVLEGLIDTSQSRRNLLDWCLFHVEPHYHAELSQYRASLDHYVAALKSPSMDESQWMTVLAEAGEKLASVRAGMAVRVGRRMGSLLSSFNNLPAVDIDYRFGWNKAKDLLDELKLRRADHLKLGYCAVGPHRSDFKFYSKKGDSKTWASRGQTKAYYYLLIISVLSVVAEDTGRVPVFLVDDLWAEFDEQVAESMIEVTAALGGQTIFTGTIASEAIKKQLNLALFHVKQGVLV
jgi:DNA replication and repair protein RecF